jgi:hypothetical protein
MNRTKAHKAIRSAEKEQVKCMSQASHVLEENYWLRYCIGLFVRAIKTGNNEELQDAFRAAEILCAPNENWTMLSSPEARQHYLNVIARIPDIDTLNWEYPD